MYVQVHKKIALGVLFVVATFGMSSFFVAMEEREDGSTLPRRDGYKETAKERIREDSEEFLGVESELKQIATSSLRSFIPKSPIYQGDVTSGTHFIPIAQASGGCSIATLYRLGRDQTRWIGKIGEENGLSKEDLTSYRTTSRTRTKKAIALDTIREKIAADLYHVLASVMKNVFITPQTCLSHQPVMNNYTDWNHFARARVEAGVTSTLRIMSRFIDGYHDFEYAETDCLSRKVSFIEFIEQNHRPPEQIYSPGGKLVPLLGAMEMFAAMRLLADTDGLGGKGKNAGFIWQRDSSGAITAARAVKIDPGYSFQFTLPEKGTSVNRVLNTARGIGTAQAQFLDSRDIQVANGEMALTLCWQSLTAEQQNQVLKALGAMIPVLTQSQEELLFCFYRDGAFNRNESEKIPEEVGHLLTHQMREWIALQQKIYDIPSGHEKIKLSYPPPLDRFAGRQEQLRLLAKKLIIDSEDKAMRVALLCGPSGIGKSELAKYFASQYMDRYHFDLIYWLQADTEANLMLSYLDLAQVLGLPLGDKSTLEIIQDAVYAALEQRELRWLLIFDNAEKEIRMPKKGGSVIVTSQRKDLWNAHAVIELSPLKKEEIMEFLKRETLEDSIESMDLVAESCGGIPLVLSAMIGLIKQGSTIVEYLQEIAENAKTSRNASFAMVWNFMFDQVKKQNAEAFELLLLCAFFHPENIPVNWLGDLSTCRRKFTRVQLHEKSLEIVKFLKSYNLIRFDSERQVFSLHRVLHEVLRQYAKSQKDSLYLKALTFLARSRHYYPGGTKDQWQASKLWSIHAEFFLSEHKAANAAIAQKTHPYQDILLSNLAEFYRELHNFSKAFDYNWRLLALRRQFYGEKHSKIATSLTEIGKVLKLQGDYERALKCYQNALERWKSIDGKCDKSYIIREISEILHLLGKESEASKYRNQLDEVDIKRAKQELEKLSREKPSEEVARQLNRACLTLELRGKYAETLQYRRQVLQMYQELHEGKPHSDVVRSLEFLSLIFKKLGKEAEASHYQQQAEEVELKSLAQNLEKQRQIGENRDDIANCLLRMGRTLWTQEKVSEAMDCCRQALAIYENEPVKERNRCHCLSLIGDILDWQGKYEEALEAYNQALTITKLKKEKIGDVEDRMDVFLLSLDNLDIGILNEKICSMLLKLSREDEALRCEAEFLTEQLTEQLEEKKQTLSGLRKCYGAEENPDMPHCLVEIGDILEAQKNYKDALEHYQQALHMYKKIHGEIANYHVASSLEKIGDILDLQGDQAAALIRYQQVLEINQKLYGRDRIVARSLDKVGRMLYLLGNYEESSQYYQQALQMRKKESEGQLLLETGITFNDRGVNSHVQGNYDEALNYYREALEIYQKILGPDAHEIVGTVLYNIGRTLDSQGKYEEALKYYQQALEMQQELYDRSPNMALNKSIKKTEQALIALADYEETLEGEDDQDYRYRVTSNTMANTTDNVIEIRSRSLSLDRLQGTNERKNRCMLQ